MKIAVIGANGQLGTDVVQCLTVHRHTVYPLTHLDIEISNIDSVANCLNQMKPAAVVNTAAMHHVEKCEQEADQAFAINATGARNLAMVTKDLGASLIHVSTDYVFDGAKLRPYVEDDIALPLNTYGHSKLAGENFVREINEKHMILRTSALYGRNSCRAKGGNNFVQRMLALGREQGEVSVVDSEVVGPTSTAALARQIARLAPCDAYGLYHATAEGECSWYEFAAEIFRASGVIVRMKVAAPAQFQGKAPRPKYSVLENRALRQLDLNCFSTWQHGLYEYLGYEHQGQAC